LHFVLIVSLKPLELIYNEYIYMTDPIFIIIYTILSRILREIIVNFFNIKIIFRFHMKYSNISYSFFIFIFY
jgi:hypothetical protein